MSSGLDPKGPSSRHQIVALLPAHNEAEHIANSVGGLLAQARVPDRIIVIADNCTDGTGAIAASFRSQSTTSQC